MEIKREMLRHCLATLAYRAGKVLRDAPEDFEDFQTGGTTRTPGRILAHLGDLLDWALAMAKGREVWKDSAPLNWNDGVNRFFTALARLDEYLASNEVIAVTEERLFQGPIADSLTHVGQIAMLRRMAGAAVRGENYFVADIEVGRIGSDQAPPRKEFD